MPDIYVYAELLLHIRRLTLYASLEEDRDQGTQVLLSSDKKVITLVYGDTTASIYLPTQIKGTANITFPTQRRTEVSTKLEIEDRNELQEVIDASPGIQVPWTASSLTPDTYLLCRACHNMLLEADTVTEWKDMPSENWAELMDLWFCHKPHEHHHDDISAAESKGFSAESKLMNEPRTGLVDTLSFILHVDDSKAVQWWRQPLLTRAGRPIAIGIFHLVISSLQPELCFQRDTDEVHAADNLRKATSPESTDGNSASSDLVCRDCGSFVGKLSQDDSSHRLWKSRIARKQRDSDEVQVFDSSVFTGAQLLQLIENTISRRVVVHEGSGPGILCWIFNPDIYYSSSKRDATVHRAMKVFYKEIDDPLGMLDENSNTLEELALPKTELASLRNILNETKTILPASARTFQEWQVGLIDRHEAKPSGLGAMDQNALNHKSDGIELFNLPPGWAELYE